MTIGPTCVIEDQLTAEVLQKIAPSLVGGRFADALSSQRWFGDKARLITGISPVVWGTEALDDDLILLLVARVTFERGDSADYFVPLLVSRTRLDSDILARITAAGEGWDATDALASDSFRRWLITSLAANATDSTGSFKWTSQPNAEPAIDRAKTFPSRISSAQQSNSSVVYGSEVMLKVFRRLSAGINPEVELGRFLTSETMFRNMPELLGEWSLSTTTQPSMSLAVAQTFIRSATDGWLYMLDAIRTQGEATTSVASRLGDVTAQMHLALASSRRVQELIPERIFESDTASWKAQTTQAIYRTASALERVADQYVGDTRELIDAFLAQLTPMTALVSGFDHLIGCSKTRVHGDFHLGQTLSTADDFIILDFEGEPQRPIAERRKKTSPLKDVAGMLRSFGYARGVIEREFPDPDRAVLVTWERSARRAFLERYVETSRAGNATYLPAFDDDIRQAVAAWELDKALYEVNYELNSRPDWLSLPLAATLKLS